MENTFRTKERRKSLHNVKTENVTSPDLRICWLKDLLLKYFDETNNKIFISMLRRKGNRGMDTINNFFQTPIVNLHEWHEMILFFYATSYEKTSYEWVYVTKKTTRPILAQPTSTSDSPPESPSKKGKSKAATKEKRGKEKKDSEKEEGIEEGEGHKKVGEDRPQSPKSVMEMTPQLECEKIIEKVKTLVKKKVTVKQFHCGKWGALATRGRNSKNNLQKHVYFYLARKTSKPVPMFQTLQEAQAEMPRYISVGNVNVNGYQDFSRRQMKTLKKHMKASLAEPELGSEEFPRTLISQCSKYCDIRNLILPYDTFFMTSSNFYQSYQRSSRKLYNDCGESNGSDSNYYKRLRENGTPAKKYTLNRIMCSPLHMIDEEISNAFYEIRQVKMIKRVDVTGKAEIPLSATLKSSLVNNLDALIKKTIWSLNHVSSDVDIEIAIWPGIEGILALTTEELLLKKDVLEKMSRKLDIWGRYLKSLLSKCRSKCAKGCGPVAEYLYWVKREERLGPLLLNLQGEKVASLVVVMERAGNPEVVEFKQRLLALANYYRIAKDNKDYISATIRALQGINEAKDMDEVKRIIPEFWKTLRYLWLLSGYWAVKTNIVGFIERVQYLIVKKCIKVLEVNHFFRIPQAISRRLAQDVLETMQRWKESFYEVKTEMEGHQWEMRWEFPLHRIFTLTDYVAKLARDFTFLSDSLGKYLEVFCPELGRVTAEERAVARYEETLRALTQPIRSADFNIYDPENDVHWNLLVETFTREISLIRATSRIVLDQAFKNLRSSVDAANFLLSLISTRQDDSDLMLMKKFEYINIQIMKEMKLLNEFIMSEIGKDPPTQHHYYHSGSIHRIRRLTHAFQSKFNYLKSIDEITNTRTYKRVETLVSNFIEFYDLHQLVIYADWISTKKDKLLYQLSQRVFKLTTCSVQHSSKTYNYQEMCMKPEPTKLIFYTKHNVQKEKQNKKSKKDSTDDFSDGEATYKNKLNEVLAYAYPFEEGARKVPLVEGAQLGRLRSRLLYLLHLEKRLLHGGEGVATNGASAFIGEGRKPEESPGTEEIEGNDVEFVKNICIPLFPSWTKDMTYEMLLSDICSTLRRISKLYSDTGELGTDPFCPLFLWTGADGREEGGQYMRENAEPLVGECGTVSPLLNRPLFRSSSPPGRPRHTLQPYQLILETRSVNGTEESFGGYLRNIFESENSGLPANNVSAPGVQEEHHEEIDLLDAMMERGALWAERGLQLEVNLDIEMFDVITELYQFIGLGFRVPQQFFGLGLLNTKLLSELAVLQAIISKYNQFVKNLLKESILLLKSYVYKIEYSLSKGLKYYKWHTTKVEHFTEVLNIQLDHVISLNMNVNDIINSINSDVNILKRIDWFGFYRLEENITLELQEIYNLIEVERNKAQTILLKVFDKVTTKLKGLEYFIFYKSSCKNDSFVLFYKYFEESILKALIENFTWNMEEFKRFISGEMRGRIRLKLLKRYFVCFDYNIHQCQTFFINAVESLLNGYKILGRWAQGTCLICPWQQSEGVHPIYRHNYLEDLVRIKAVAYTLVDHGNLLEAVTSKLSKYLESNAIDGFNPRWEPYRVLWNYDKLITTENLFKDTTNIIEKSDVLFCYYDVFIDELEKSKDHADIFCFRIDVRIAKDEILNEAIQSKNLLKFKLADLAEQRFSAAFDKLAQIHEVMSTDIFGLEGYQNALQCVKDFQDLRCVYGEAVTFISEIKYILGRHGLKYPNISSSRQVGDTTENYAESRALVRYRMLLLQPSLSNYRQLSRERTRRFQEECVRFAESYGATGPGSVGENLDLGLQLIQVYEKDFEDLNMRRKEMTQAELLFQHEAHSYDVFDEAYREFRLVKTAYQLYSRQKEVRNQWSQIPWIYLNHKELMEGINSFLTEFADLPDEVRMLPVAKEIEKSMENFKESIPIMVNLKNEALKERHWKELMEKTDYFFEMAASRFILDDMFSMMLYRHRTTVDDIIGKAERELCIQRLIEKMKKFWKSQLLQQSPSENGLLVLDNNLELLQLLEDYEVDLHRISQSQFGIPFKEDIQDWEKKLAQIHAILLCWTELQDEMTNISQIFEMRKSQKTFPDLFKFYESVKDSYNKLTRSVQYKQNLVEQAATAGLLKAISGLGGEVEGLRFGLSELLSDLRQSSPRLRLLSDRQLFPLLGPAVQDKIRIVLPKVFTNISDVIIGKNEEAEEDVDIRGLLSSEEEILKFTNIVPVDDRFPSWTQTIEDEMKASTKYSIKMAIFNYATIDEPRTKWILENINSATLAAIRVWWTAEVEHTFSKIKEGNHRAMKTHLEQLNHQLQEPIKLVKGNLDSLERMKLINVILLDMHHKNVIDRFANMSVMSVNDFEWESQMKFYWRKTADNLIIEQCLGSFNHGYEYMGVGSEAAIGPETEKTHLSITQALSNYFNVLVFGPPSSGKAERIGSLSRALGYFCAFTSCTELTSLEGLWDTVRSACEDGHWVCFQGISDISAPNLSLLSQLLGDVKAALTSNAPVFMLEGNEVKLMKNIGLFGSVTLKPGFGASFKVLPLTLRLVFRQVACLPPSIEQVSYVLLTAQGFTEAMALSRKIGKLYDLSKDQLSPGGNYDFGLRSVKPLLTGAGDLKRAAPDIPEHVLLMRAIRDTNRWKILPEDEQVFSELRECFFPEVECPPIGHPHLEAAIEKRWKQMGYLYIPQQAAKVLQLYEGTRLNRGCIVYGGSGGGKSTIISTFAQCHHDIGIPTSLVKVNPKAVPMWELYGYFEEEGWRDGLLTKVVRDLNRDLEGPGESYLLCDGALDQHWLEGLRSALDERAALHLSTSERICLQPSFRIIFEAQHSTSRWAASGVIRHLLTVDGTRAGGEGALLGPRPFFRPAVVGEDLMHGLQLRRMTGSIMDSSPDMISRCGVVYVDAENLGPRPYWERWLVGRIDPDEGQLLEGLYQQYFIPALTLLGSGELCLLINLTHLQMVKQLCFVIDAFYPIIEKEIGIEVPQHPNETDGADDVSQKEMESMFIFAMYWSLGTCLMQKSKPIFDNFIKTVTKFQLIESQEGNKASLGSLPCAGTLFDYWPCRERKCWVPWKEMVPEYVHDESFGFDEIIVPTEFSCRILTLMKGMMEYNVADPVYKSYKYKVKAKKKIKRPLLLIGGRSSSKTTLMKEFSRALNKEQYETLSLTMSYKTRAKDLQLPLESSLISYTPTTLVPRAQRKLIMFVDDLNRPETDLYKTQEVTQFLKLLIENSGLFSRKYNFEWKNLNEVYLIGTLGNEDGEGLDPRFTSHFSVLSCESPSDETLTSIYTAILGGHLVSFQDAVKLTRDKLILASIEIFQFCRRVLKPSPTKFHYFFNARDISRMMEGILQASPNFYKQPRQFIRLWRNEITRTYSDRLISKEDKELFEKEVCRGVEKWFPECAKYVLRNPLLFGDYRNAMEPKLPRDYEDILDYEASYHLFTEVMEHMKKEDKDVNVVLLVEVLDHLTRVQRILRIRRRHCLLVGPPGIGKRTTVRLASFTAGCEVYSVTLGEGRTAEEFMKDVRNVFCQVCIEDKPTTFLITSHLSLNQEILNLLNIVLETGSLSGIFSREEKHEIVNEYFFKFYDRLEGERSMFWEEVDKLCKKNLHICLTVGRWDREMRLNCQRYPAIIDYTAVNWMEPWPREALVAIARRRLKDEELLENRQTEGVIEAGVEVQWTASQLPRYGGKMVENHATSAWVTPSHCLQFLQLFVSILREKHLYANNQRDQLRRSIEKINEAEVQLGKMKLDLESQKGFLQEKTAVCDGLEKNISETLGFLEKQKNEQSVKVQEIDVLDSEIKQQMSEINETLSGAMKEIEKAQESVRDLDIEDLRTLSLTESPTETTTLVFESVVILAGSQGVSWSEVRHALADPHFLSRLEGLNLNLISLPQQKLVMARLKRIERMGIPEEKTAVDTAFLGLVQSILSYCSAFRETKPKQEKISEIQKELDKAQSSLNLFNAEVEKTEVNLKDLRERLEAALGERDEANLLQDSSLLKMEAAEKLLKALERDYACWKSRLQQLDDGFPKIVGNSLMITGFQIYCGSLPYNERNLLLSKWEDFIRRKSIPLSKPFSIEKEANELELDEWCDVAPKNDWAVQSAMLLNLSFKPPLCLDPKQQATRWIINKEINLVILNYAEDNILSLIEDKISSGHPILVKEVASMDPNTLQGIINIINTRTPPNEAITLYMTTNMSCPDFDPLIFAYTNIINFSITEAELEEIILDEIIETDEKDVWERKKETGRRELTERKRRQELSEMLEAETSGGDVRSAGWIERLGGIKERLDQVEKVIKESEIIQSGIEDIKSKYKDVAKCGATLYFTMEQQFNISNFYRISLPLFLRLFHIARKSPHNSGIIEPLQNVKRFFSKFCYRGVSSEHKRLILFQLAISLQKSEGIIQDKEIQFLIHGSNKHKEKMILPFEWLTQEGWRDLEHLSKDFRTPFGSVLDHIATNKSEWDAWYYRKDKLDFPQPMELNFFQKLMLLRCLRIESLVEYSEQYSEYVMGTQEASSPPSLDGIIEESFPDIPIILIVPPGMEPMVKINKLAHCQNKDQIVQKLTIGSENIYEAEKLLRSGISSGSWVVLLNCHLRYDFLSSLREILESVSPIQNEFRLWIIIESNAVIPKNLAESSVRVFLDPVESMNGRLECMYHDMEDELMSSFSHPYSLRILYATAFLHVLLQERKKYQRQGWNGDYDFGDDDFYLSAATIKSQLEHLVQNQCQDFPKKSLKALFSEVIYGGYFLDDYDKAITATYLEEYFDNYLLHIKPIFTFFSGEIDASQDIPEETKTDFIEGIRSIRQLDSSVLGLHPINEFFYKKRIVDEMLKNLRSTELVEEIEGKDEMSVAEVTQFLEAIPGRLELKPILVSSDQDERSLRPLHHHLKQEVTAFNLLLTQLSSSLNLLRLGLEGEIAITEGLEDLWRGLKRGVIPARWRGLCGASRSPASLPAWLASLRARSHQYANWILEGELKSVWLGGLERPKSYLLAVLQVAANKSGRHLENLTFQTNITNIKEAHQSLEVPEEGCYISGAYLEGAVWNGELAGLGAAGPLITPLPLLHLVPKEKFTLPLKNTLKIPVYRTRERNRRGNGLVFEADIQTSVHISKWILQGVCITLTND